MKINKAELSWHGFDFGNLKKLAKLGFEGRSTIACLMESRKVIPSDHGIYLVVRISKKKVGFLLKSSGDHINGRDTTESVPILKECWLTGPKVLYIGKAGGSSNETTLRGRLNQYLRFMPNYWLI